MLSTFEMVTIMHAENYIHLGKRITQEADRIYIHT